MEVAYGPPGKKGVDELWAVSNSPDGIGDAAEENRVLMVTTGVYVLGAVLKSRFLKDASVGAGVTLLVLRLLGR